MKKIIVPTLILLVLLLLGPLEEVLELAEILPESLWRRSRTLDARRHAGGAIQALFFPSSGVIQYVWRAIGFGNLVVLLAAHRA